MSWIKHSGPGRPMCRWCGTDLPKHSVTHWIVRDPNSYKTERHRYLQAPLMNRAECQRHVNGHVISVKYHDDRSHGVWSFGVWDGETYEASHGFFCTNNCAMDMGRAAARKDFAGPGYNRRIAEMRSQEEKV